MGQFEAGAGVKGVIILMMLIEGDKTGAVNNTQDKL